MSSTAEAPVWSATRAGVIEGLRALATALEEDGRVPVPTSLDCVAPDAATVWRAARTPYGTVTTERNGQTAAGLRFGAVTLRVFHVSEDAMERYHAVQSYAGAVQP